MCVQTNPSSYDNPAMSVSGESSSGDYDVESNFNTEMVPAFQIDIAGRQAPQNNEDNVEMVYIRDVLLAQHPFLPDVENAVGRLTDSDNADLLNAEALSELIDPDQILLEALRTLSDDPSMRKLQASLEVETCMINHETAVYQTIQSASLSLPSSSTKCEGPKNKRKKFSSSASKPCGRVVKKREKTPPESQKLLKDWLFTHSHHPYPTDGEKDQLCTLTGLSLQQLNNWFINARRRILPNFIQEQQKTDSVTKCSDIPFTCQK